MPSIWISSAYLPQPCTFSGTSRRWARWPTPVTAGADKCSAPSRKSRAARRMASMIFLYPVQRQILLRMATAASSRVGSGFRSMRPLAHSTIPGMQKPHCTAPAAPKA